MVYKSAHFIKSAVHPRDFPVHDRREVALVGRSNVGKSSLVNTLVPMRRLAHVSKRPGRTQTINFFALTDQLCLVDLPGYGYAQVSQKTRESWRRMIETYLKERDQLALLILLIDGRHGPSEDDVTMWQWAKYHQTNIQVVATKWDKVKKSERSRRLAAMSDSLEEEPIPFSAVSGDGKDRIVRILNSIATSSRAN